MKRLLGYAGVTLALLFLGLFVVAQIDLVTFKAGDLIRADEVNGNFQALAEALEANRMPQGCESGQVAEWNGSDWACGEDDVGDVGSGLTAVSHDATMAGDGTTGNPLALAQQGASAGQVLEWNGAAWTPAPDDDTEYTAGSGLQLSGTTFSIRNDGVSSSMIDLPLALTAGATKVLDITGSGSGISNAALRVDNANRGIGAFISGSATGSSDAALVISQKGDGPLFKAFGSDGGNEEFRIDTNGSVWMWKPSSDVNHIKLDNLNGSIRATAFNTSSDRALKEGFSQVDKGEILTRLADLPIGSWTFKSEPAIRHLGPTAQDFYAAFGLGADGEHIATVDADGVALIAIQALYEENLLLRSHLAEVEARLQNLEEGSSLR